MLSYISNIAHYKEVLSRVPKVKHNLWIGTADIKDLYVEDGKQKKPFLAVLAGLIRRGVEVPFMPKNLVRTSERILTSTRYSMTVWSVSYVHVFISR